MSIRFLRQKLVSQRIQGHVQIRVADRVRPEADVKATGCVTLTEGIIACVVDVLVVADAEKIGGPMGERLKCSFLVMLIPI